VSQFFVADLQLRCVDQRILFRLDGRSVPKRVKSCHGGCSRLLMSLDAGQREWFAEPGGVASGRAEARNRRGSGLALCPPGWRAGQDAGPMQDRIARRAAPGKAPTRSAVSSTIWSTDGCEVGSQAVKGKTLAWPSRSLRTFRSMPALSERVALVWRTSWSWNRGTLARSASRLNIRVMVCGCGARPSG
jgi:hypothetical protein